MNDKIRIIVNADDFGGTNSCTDAIYFAFQKGNITDTTIMANGDSYEKAITYIKSDDLLATAIGIHVNLTAGKPLTEPIKECQRLVRNNKFTKYLLSPKGKLLPLSRKEKLAIAKEIQTQIQKCISDGIVLSHADSHHHVHANPQVTPIFLNACRNAKINKVRIYKNIVDRGFFRNQYYRWHNQQMNRKGFCTTDWFGNMKECISPLSARQSTIEIMVHPDFTKDGVLINREGSDKNGNFGINLEDECRRVRLLLNGEFINYATL